MTRERQPSVRGKRLIAALLVLSACGSASQTPSAGTVQSTTPQTATSVTPTLLATPLASAAVPSWPPASIGPGAGVDHACVLSESQAEAILGRDVAAPEVAEGAYDRVACRIATLDSDFPHELFIEMSPPVFDAARQVNDTAESDARWRQLPTHQPAYFTSDDEALDFGGVVFALGDHVVMMSWRATEGETADDLAAKAVAFVEAITANWSGEE